MFARALVSVFSITLICQYWFSNAAAPDYVIDLSSSVNMPNTVAVQVCAGLLNRESSSPSVYTLLNEPYDSQWLHDIEGIENPTLTSVDAFLDKCLSTTKVSFPPLLYSLY